MVVGVVVTVEGVADAVLVAVAARLVIAVVVVADRAVVGEPSNRVITAEVADRADLTPTQGVDHKTQNEFVL